MQIGVVGASGYLGAELLRLLAGHPAFDVAVVQADSSAGQQVAELYPNLAPCYGGLVFSPLDAGACSGSRRRLHRTALRSVPGIRAHSGGDRAARCGPGRRLPPERRLAVPDLVRLRAPGSGAARPLRLRTAGAVPTTASGRQARRSAGVLCHRGHHGTCVFSESGGHRADGGGRGRGERGLGRRTLTVGELPSSRCQRELLRIRAHQPSPHPRDGAGDRGADPVHCATSRR